MDKEETSTAVDVETLPTSKLVEYLSRACPLLLDVETVDFDSSVSVTVNKRIIEDFISDTRNQVLVVKKTTIEQNGMYDHQVFISKM